MRAAIRVDATAQIGTGHLMRTLTLADRLAAGGGRVRFVARGLPPHLAALVRRRHELAELPPAPSPCPGPGDLAHSHWLAVSQAEDAAQTLAVLADQTWDWIVADHYALDARWECALRMSGRRVLAIDDLADRMHDCDLLLDQNLVPGAPTRYQGRAPAGCRLLLGPAYALLREEFAATRARPHLRRDGPARRLMVFMGGMDVANHTGRVLAGIERAGVGPLEGDVVIGVQHPAGATIEEQCRRLGLTCHRQTDRMAEMMARADLGIGATGSASWERCCLGLPTIGVAIASNQVPLAEGLAAAGAIVRIAEAPGRMEEDLAAALRELWADAPRREAMAAAARALVDGEGAHRVEAAMTTLQ